jgi:hypothetical protein
MYSGRAGTAGGAKPGGWRATRIGGGPAIRRLGGKAGISVDLPRIVRNES